MYIYNSEYVSLTILAMYSSFVSVRSTLSELSGELGISISSKALRNLREAEVKEVIRNDEGVCAASKGDQNDDRCEKLAGYCLQRTISESK